MKSFNELESLQNAADDLGLVIHRKQCEDKRKKVPMYFAQHGDETVSPVLSYQEMNHFLLGWRAGLKPSKNKSSSGFENGEIVWDSNNKCYGVVLNNYGNDHQGEVRLDSDGNQPISDLYKLGSEGDKGTKKQLIDCLESHKRLILKSTWTVYERVFY